MCLVRSSGVSGCPHLRWLQCHLTREPEPEYHAQVVESDCNPVSHGARLMTGGLGRVKRLWEVEMPSNQVLASDPGSSLAPVSLSGS